MKKLLLSGALLASFTLAMTSCGENKDAKTGDTPATETAATPEADKPADAPEATVSSDVPKFSSEEVNKGLADYKALVEAYVEAYKSKDQAKISALTTQAQKFATESAAWSQKLKPEEAQQYSEYMQKLGQEMAAAMSAK